MLKSTDHKGMDIFLHSQFDSIDVYVYPYATTTVLIVLAILGPLNFHMNPQISLSISEKENPADIWLGNALNL